MLFLVRSLLKAFIYLQSGFVGLVHKAYSHVELANVSHKIVNKPITNIHNTS